MNVEIITIGNELLMGQVVDTNTARMGQELNKYGFEVLRSTSVRDVSQEIKSAVEESLMRADIVLITGGLGPTKDDITKQVLCDLYKMKLRFDETVYSDVANFLKGRVEVINGLNRAQAMVPEGCTVIRNRVGTAPAMWFERENKVVVSMPGVPSEMEYLMKNEIVPRLTSRFDIGVIIHKTVMVAQLPESELAERIAEWEDTLDKSLSLAYLPSPGKVKLRITGRGNNKAIIEEKIAQSVKQLNTLIGEYIFGYDDELPEKKAGEILTASKKTVATAESCTGGYIAHRITSIAGSSAYFKGSVVAYSNEVKINLLGVAPSSIERDGAVSRTVVEQMAEGVRHGLGTDIGIATSGIAGPGGGSFEKPVGTIWIALSTPDGIISKKYKFGTNRELNILRSGETALILLLQYLNGDLNITT